MSNSCYNGNTSSKAGLQLRKKYEVARLQYMMEMCPRISLYTYCHLCNAATFKGWAGPTLHEAGNLRAQLGIFYLQKTFSVSENIFQLQKTFPIYLGYQWLDKIIHVDIITTLTQIGLGEDLTFLLLLFMINRVKLDHNFNYKLTFNVKVMECYKITHLW
jgi:hypothetical protein